MRRILMAAALVAACGKSSPTPIDPLDGVTVSLRPASGVGWTVHIENKRAQTINVLWNESAFVDASGKSLGKLIPGETRKMDAARTLASEPVPAGAHIDEEVLLASMGDASENGLALSGSGRASIEIDTGSGKASWSGDASFAIAKAQWWCDAGKSGGGMCFVDRDECDRFAKSNRCVPDPDAAWCFDEDRAIESGAALRSTSCFIVEAACKSFHDFEAGQPRSSFQAVPSSACKSFATSDGINLGPRRVVVTPEKPAPQWCVANKFYVTGCFATKDECEAQIAKGAAGHCEAK